MLSDSSRCLSRFTGFPGSETVSLGVVVSGLVTNAVRCSCTPGESGEIRVILQPDANGIRANLTGEDDGPGLGVRARLAFDL